MGRKKDSITMNRLVALCGIIVRVAICLAAVLCLLACMQGERIATTPSSVSGGDNSTSSPLPRLTPSRPTPWSDQMLLVSDGDEEHWLVPETVQTQVLNDLARIQIAVQLDLILGPSDYLLSDYYLPPELESQMELAEERRLSNANIVADGPGRMHRGTLLHCTPDGWECLVVDRVVGGTIQIRDPATGQLVEEHPGPSVCQFIRVRHDDQNGCWKIAEYGESYETDRQECP